MAITISNTFIGADAYSFNSAPANGIQYTNSSTVTIVAGSRTWDFSQNGTLLMTVCSGHTPINPGALGTFNSEFATHIPLRSGTIMQLAVGPSYSQTITAGSATAQIYKNANPSGLPSLTVAGNITANSYTPGTYNFNAGDNLHITVTTSAGFAIASGGYLEVYMVIAV